MYKRLTIYYLTIFSALCTLCVLFSSIAIAVTTTQDGTSYHIEDVQTKTTEDSLLITIKGNSVPAYATRTLYNPHRLVLDIANVSLKETLTIDSLVSENKHIEVQTMGLSDQNHSVTRFEFKLKDSYQHNVDSKENDLLIHFTKLATTGAMTGSGVASINDMRIDKSPQETMITFVSDQPIQEFKEDILAGNDKLPPRLYIDINNVDATKLVRETSIGTSVDKVRVASRGSGVRIVLESGLKEIFNYDIKSAPQGLAIAIEENSTFPVNVSANNQAPATKNDASDATLDELIDSSEETARIKKTEKFDQSFDVSNTAANFQDKFQFSGYTKKRISVDFYKIDLHNVFRLFRQVSDLNLIVDESVTGTLTLALDNVPWDFALDIILNLSDLEKEERFNTMVIYPKKKEFVWPERSEDNLSFEADIEIVEQEALIIQQAENQPKEIMLAKEILRKAKAAEKSGNYEKAVDLYVKASELWPSNSKITNRIAAIYLVHLNINAKAIYYAKKSLEIKSDDTEAALTAAIGYANMEKIAEAAEYFNQSISNSPPRKEALLSYAAFNENNNRPAAAIKVLDKYHTHYGETVETMVAKARIYDKLVLPEKANSQYKLIYNSGYPLRPDLRKYIESRIADGQ